jgi:two-component system nitrogen regulation sensor histidine kinase GlnL
MNAASWQAWADRLATAVASLDRDLRVRWQNDALAELLGSGTRSALGQPLALWLCDPAALAQVARARAEAGALQLREVTLLTFDERRLAADLAVQPDGEGGALLEVHALAERPPAASPLSATLRGFAHEVKNPLAGLRGAAQLLKRRVEGAELQALAGLIIDEADRLAALANHLLRHDGAPQWAEVNIHQVLDRLSGLLQAEPAPPRLQHDFDPSLPDLRGDADRLLQLLLNLGRNAVEAGARTLILRTRAEHGVRLGARLLRSALRVDVIDDGPGVPADVRDTLFEPLVSGRVDGTGLGLALSREIAREHGGELRCTSAPGHTVFSLYLPLEHAHA